MTITTALLFILRILSVGIWEMLPNEEGTENALNPPEGWEEVEGTDW
jgi:hypothetical protein